MRRLFSAVLACTLSAALLGGSAGYARAAESPFVGTWKFTLLLPGLDADIYLLEIADVDGKLQGKILSAGIPNFAKDAKVESIQPDSDKTLRLKIQSAAVAFPITVHSTSADRLLGHTLFQGQRRFVRLEKSDLKKLDPDKAQIPSPNGPKINEALEKEDPKEKLAAIKQFLATKDLEPALRYAAGLELLGAMAAAGEESKAATKQAQETIKVAAEYGPEMKLLATQQAAQRLADSDKLAPVAVDLAREAEKLLDKNTPTETQAAVLRTLKAALTKAGKDVEAKSLAPKVAQLEDQLDQEFLKDAVPFKTEAYARKDPGSRVVLVELFTGAQCPPCVAADVAFDALLRSCKPTDVVFLQYHLHIPRPDPLTNEDAEKRFEYYTSRESESGTPTFVIDGALKKPGVGGPKALGKEAYDEILKKIGEAQEIGAQAKIALKAENKGGKIDIHAEISDLAKTGEKVRLRLVLVEEVARFQGTNGQRLHHHVVRAFPGGMEGFALTEKNVKQNVRVNLADVAKDLNDYLDKYKGRKFSSDERSLNLKHLKLVAFIQSDRADDDKGIFQAAQVDVPTAGE